MLSRLHFVDHPRFHRQVLFASAGASLGGLLLALPSGLLGVGVDLDNALIVLGVSFAAALGMVDGTIKIALRRAMIFALIAALPLALSVLMQQRYPYLALALSGLSLAFLFHLSQADWRQRFLAALLGIPCMILAAFAALRYGRFIVDGQYMSPALAVILASTLAGFIFSAGLGLGYVRVSRDPLAQRFAKAKSSLKGVWREQAQEAQKLNQLIQNDLARLDLHEALAQDIRGQSRVLCTHLLQNAEHWQALQSEHAPGQQAALRKRMDEITMAATAAKDPAAAAQYKRAESNLSSQIEYLDSISRKQERAMAQQVAQLSLLEKLRFSLLSYRASDSELLAEHLRDMAQELEDLTGHVDLIGEAYELS